MEEMYGVLVIYSSFVLFFFCLSFAPPPCLFCHSSPAETLPLTYMRQIFFLCLSLPLFTPPFQLAAWTPFFFTLLSAVSPCTVSTWEEFPVRMCVYTLIWKWILQQQAWKIHLPLNNSRSLETLQALIRLCLWNTNEVICKHGSNKQEQTSLSAVMAFPP